MRQNDAKSWKPGKQHIRLHKQDLKFNIAKIFHDLWQVAVIRAYILLNLNKTRGTLPVLAQLSTNMPSFRHLNKSPVQIADLVAGNIGIVEQHMHSFDRILRDDFEDQIAWLVEGRDKQIIALTKLRQESNALLTRLAVDLSCSGTETKTLVVLIKNVEADKNHVIIMANDLIDESERLNSSMLSKLFKFSSSSRFFTLSHSLFYISPQNDQCKYETVDINCEKRLET